MKRYLIALFLVISIALPSLAFAGYVFEKEMDAGKNKMTMVYSLEGKNKRIDIVQNGTMVTSMISTPKLSNPLVLIHAKKKYMEQKSMDEKQRSAMRKSAMKSMMGNSNMSKEQKAAMQKMMKAKSEAKMKDSRDFKAKDFSVTSTGESKKIGKYNTKLVKVFYKGKHFQDNWVTKDIPKDAVKAINAFSEDNKLTASKEHKAFKKIKKMVIKYGTPVLTVSKINEDTMAFYGNAFHGPTGTPKEVRVEMKKIEKKSITDSSFKVPKEYKPMSASM